MPNDVPIVIRVLELVGGGAMPIRTLRERVSEESGATGEVVVHLLEAMHRESLVRWSLADAGGERPASLRDAHDRGESVSCSVSEAGRSTLGDWERARREGGWTVEDSPWESVAPLSPPPRHPGRRALYALWEASLKIRAPDRASADSAVCSFGSLLPHLEVLAVEPEVPDPGASVQLLVRYRFKRRYVFRFDPVAIRTRGGPPESWRLDLPWSEIAAVGIGEIDLGFSGPFLVIRMMDRKTWKFEMWGDGVDEVLDFVKSFPGADSDANWFGARRKPWFWERGAGDLPELRARYARFWDRDEIEARKRAAARRNAAAAARHEARLAEIRDSRWRWIFWKKDGSDRLLGQIGLPVLIILVLGLTWRWLFGPR